MYYCAYSGSFGEYACNPRTLGSQHLNRMVSLEGIVTKCSLVRPKVVQSVHWNEKEQSFLVRKYQDQTMSANGPTSLSVYPQEDDKHNPVSRFCVVVVAAANGPAYNGIRLLYISRPPDDFNSRNAGESTCWPASSRRGCDYGR